MDIDVVQEVITAKDLTSQTNVRLMASVYFKNSINRYWRNRRDSMCVIYLFVSYISVASAAHVQRIASGHLVMYSVKSISFGIDSKLEYLSMLTI